jgi:membrane-associated protein
LDILLSAWDLIVHLDKHLALLVQNYGGWVYLILFAIVFCETGLVVTPFLPGDSLLFIAGSLVAVGDLNVHVLVLLLFVAAVLGNLSNYAIGHFFGQRFFVDRNARFLNPEYLQKTHAFYEKWGPAAVIVARFAPFLRTYVPFVAGMGAMSRTAFVTYTVIGAAAWVGALVYLGYFFGNIPWIKANQGFLVIGIVLLSLLPVAIGIIKARFSRASR